MKKLVVYGLPRSGTNYLEFLVRQNLQCIYDPGERECEYFDGTINAVKHCKPDANDGDVFVFLVRNRWDFITSFNNYQHWPDEPRVWEREYDPQDLFYSFITDMTEFRNKMKELVFVAYHEDILENEYAVISAISKQFDIPMNKHFITTRYRMGERSGTVVTDQIFRP